MDIYSLRYFFPALERLFQPGYMPTPDDIVNTRARTIGITETAFDLHDHQMIMVDVGGQKSERRKWIHCFQDVTSILFLVSLSGYDQCLVEDKDAVSLWFWTFVILVMVLTNWMRLVEPNAGRDDDMGLDLP
jgi:hypothetical protein